MENTITINGSEGEGGGQILRTAMSLAAITGQPLIIDHIRAGRKKPGLMRQHLTCVRAVASICGGELEGDEPGSQQLGFTPGAVQAGDYRFAVGSAGSACLVAQTVLPVLLSVAGASTCRFAGGTHNPMAPPFDFLQQCFLPILAKMGLLYEAELRQYGFYPAGGGEFSLAIQPPVRLLPLSLLERGELSEHCITAVAANLPVSIARREAITAGKKLQWPQSSLRIVELNKPTDGVIGSVGPGNMLSACVRHSHGCEMVAGFGEKGLSAERVARRVAGQMQRYIDSGAVIGEHLADQLLLPMALAGSGEFTTTEPSMHSRSNAEVIQRFLPVRIVMEAMGEKLWRVTVVSIEN